MELGKSRNFGYNFDLEGCDTMLHVLRNDRELKFPHIYIVNASAGSGKTHLLASRYVQFLLSSKIPNSELPQIIAITFTNKATVEMQRKILKILKSLAVYGTDGNIPEVKLVAELLSDMKPTEIKELARAKVEEIIENFTDFQVKTIDSFVNSIIKSSAYDIGLPPDFNIVEDKRRHIELAVDSLLFKLATDNALLRLFLDYLVESFIEIEESGSWRLRRSFINLVKPLLEKEFNTGMKMQFISVQEFNRTERELKKLANKLLGMIQSFGFEDKVQANLLKSLERIAGGDIKGGLSFKVWAGDPSKIAKGGSKLHPEILKTFEEVRALRDRWAFLRAHVDVAYYKKLTDAVKNELEYLKQRKKLVFIDELNVKVREFMERLANVPSVFFLLGEKLFHFLIDEFQDTSILQWSNLRPIIEEALSKGGSLFAVGDQKQLLFRFRGSDYGLFEKAIGSFPSVPSEQVYLTSTKTNWRSRRTIVEFNNKVFDKKNISRLFELVGLDELDLSEIYDVPPQSVPNSPDRDGGFVYAEVIKWTDADEKEELIRQKLIDTLKSDILLRYEPREVAILVRKNSEGEKIAQWLVAEGIPVASERSLDIRKDPILIGLLSFLKFLDTPADDVSFFGFVLSDIFTKAANLDKEKVIRWAETKRFGLPNPSTNELVLFQENAPKKPAYVSFREDFQSIWEQWIDEFFVNVGFLPPYDLVNRIIRKWRVLQHFPHVEGHLMRLLEILRVQEDIGFGSLSAFIETLNSGYDDEKFYVPAPEELNSVRILTVHKAKGLEFNVVIVPFAELRIKQRSGSDKGQTLHIRVDSNGAYPWKRVSLRNVDTFESYREITLREDAHNLLDELNILYVAMTRPKDELYVFINIKDTEKSNKGKGQQKSKSKRRNSKSPGELVRALIFDVFGIDEDQNVLTFGRKVAQAQKPVERISEQREVPVSSKTWHVGIVRESIPVEDVIGRRFEAIRRGEFIHRALAKIDNFLRTWDLPSLKNALTKSLYAALSYFPEFEDEIDEIAQELAENLTQLSGISQWFLTPPETKVLCEKEIIDANGKTLRIDRLLLSKDEAVIIEYKTGEPVDAQHVKQVEHYIRTISRIYPDLSVSGFLLYLDKPLLINVKQ